jgi:hypothetical protein
MLNPRSRNKNVETSTLEKTVMKRVLPVKIESCGVISCLQSLGHLYPRTEFRIKFRVLPLRWPPPHPSRCTWCTTGESIKDLHSIRRSKFRQEEASP